MRYPYLRIPAAKASAAAAFVTSTILCAVAISVPPGGVTPDPGAVLSVAVGLGLTPEALAVSGFNSAQTAVALGNLVAATELRQALAAGMMSTSQTAATVADLTHQVGLLGAGEGLGSQLQSAQVQLQSAHAQTELIRSQLFSLAVAEASSGQVGLLTNCRTSQSYGLPPEFKVVTRTDEQWKAIIRALRAESRSIRMGSVLAPESASLLADVRAEPAVTAAKQRLDAQLVSIQQQFFTSLGPS